MKDENDWMTPSSDDDLGNIGGVCGGRLSALSPLRVDQSKCDSLSKMTDAKKVREPDEPSERALPFLIRRDGTWLYRGTPVRRKPMICLFGSMLTRDADGTFRLQTPTERGTIQVEDAPFLAVELEFKGNCGRHQTLCLRTNIDEVVSVGPDHPLEVAWDRPCCEETAPVPYVVVRKGDGEWPLLARLTRSVYYELAALALPGQVAGKSCFGVWSRDCFFPLGRRF